MDLRAHKTQDWALCTHRPLREAGGLATEHTGTEDLLMEDTGSIPPIRTLMEREASAIEPQFRVFSLQRHHGHYHVSAVISVLMSLQMHRCSETVGERVI